MRGEAGPRQGQPQGLGLCPPCRARAEARRGDRPSRAGVLPGPEYSVDALADLDGRPLVAVPRRRLAVRDGVSVHARVERDTEIERLSLAMAAALGVRGPVCMQLRHDADAAPRFTEVNPRMGCGTFFAALAGVNLAACCLDLAAGRPLPALRFAEITVVRYFEEIVVDA